MVVTGTQSGLRRISIHRSVTSSTIAVTSSIDSGSKVAATAAGSLLERVGRVRVIETSGNRCFPVSRDTPGW